MSGLNQGVVRQPDTKAIAHSLLVVAQGVEFEAVSCEAVIGDDHGGAGGTKEKSLQIKWKLLFLLAPVIGQMGLLRVEPPLVSAAFAYFPWPSFGLGHSQLMWAQT